MANFLKGLILNCVILISHNSFSTNSSTEELEQERFLVATYFDKYQKDHILCIDVASAKDPYVREPLYRLGIPQYSKN